MRVSPSPNRRGRTGPVPPPVVPAPRTGRERLPLWPMLWLPPLGVVGAHIGGRVLDARVDPGHPWLAPASTAAYGVSAACGAIVLVACVALVYRLAGGLGSVGANLLVSVLVALLLSLARAFLP